MCLEPETMVDRIEQARHPRPDIRIRPLVEGTCLVMIEAAGFAAGIVLVVLGLPLFVFLALAGWDLGLLFAQAWEPAGELDERLEDAAALLGRCARLAGSEQVALTSSAHAQ